MKEIEKDKIIVVLGPTSSGKSDLAVDLAKKFNGEVISADSRQVFKGLDIGSGKVTKKEMKGIPHYLLDVVSPNRPYSVTQFKKKVEKTIKDILKRGKTPIVAGGTGFYIQAIVDNVFLPEVKPNLKLRKELEKFLKEDKEKALKEMGKRLKKLDQQRFKEIDQKNPRRLMRAIEIATALGKVPQLKKVQESNSCKFGVLQIGIKTDKDVLNKRIAKRFEKRVRAGIVKEAENLHKKGLTWKRMSELGLAHKYIALYLRNKMSKKEMIEKSIKEEEKYAKRQRTWFKRDKRIYWFRYEDQKKVFDLVEKFLK